MNQKPYMFLNKIIGCCLVAAGLFAVVQVFAAQPIILGAPPHQTAPAAVLDAQTNNDMAVFVPTGQEVRDDSLPQPFKFGKVVFRPHASYQLIYANGLEAGRTAYVIGGHTNFARRAVNTIIQTISPGLTVDLGRHWTLDYTPSIRLYSNDAFHDVVDHSASIIGSVAYEDWLFGLNQTFLITDSTLAETAAQTKQELYNTLLTASHQLSEKYSTDLSLRQQFTFVEGQQDSRTWSTLDWLNYQVGKRFYIGVGGGLGYVNTDIGPDQVYEQLQGRAQWRASEKVSASVNAGIDYRQFLSGGGDSLNPIFGLSVEYLPFKHTQITFSADRSVGSSDYDTSSQSTETTTVSVSLNQRLLEKYYLSSSVGYIRTEYTNPDVRSDDNYFITARLGRNFLKRGNVAITYQYSDNQSNQSGFSYRSNQIGIEVGFAY